MVGVRLDLEMAEQARGKVGGLFRVQTRPKNLATKILNFKLINAHSQIGHTTYNMCVKYDGVLFRFR